MNWVEPRLQTTPPRKALNFRFRRGQLSLSFDPFLLLKTSTGPRLRSILGEERVAIRGRLWFVISARRRLKTVVKNLKLRLFVLLTVEIACVDWCAVFSRLRPLSSLIWVDGWLLLKWNLGDDCRLKNLLLLFWACMVKSTIVIRGFSFSIFRIDGYCDD